MNEMVGSRPRWLQDRLFGPRAMLIARPKADLANGKSAEVAGRSNSAVRLAAPEDRPRKLLRYSKQNTAIAKRNASAVPKGANLRHGIVSVNTQRPHKQPMQKATRMKPAETRAMHTRPIFDWPVHGKILARFGSRSNGEKSDGVTIAVAEDTPISCAQDGVVIYAGSGLKGFGNLVLLRHANNYVTVYAHAKDLKVKRGDQIKRGDVIGTSGQSGNASTPQIYFEVRKHSMPVDPLPLLKDGSERHVGQRAATAIWPEHHGFGSREMASACAAGRAHQILTSARFAHSTSKTRAG